MGEKPDDRAKDRRLIADRYEVAEELGRGGAAVVYRVHDPLSQRELALKQLSVERHGQHTSDLAVLFQREFHTLAQLTHPRIIEVFDFGVDEHGPYYTMELLAGGDLRSRAPLAWQDACRLLYDVCSSLALIHARRWVHRDVTPLNIRCTHDGRAKLIDFGAMVPMGPCEVGVGTPPFTAPEVIQRSVLDARTDLFSVGATLYYVLTGRNAYPARTFAQLPLLWQKPPAPPSVYVDVPPGLDTLVLSLLRPEPMARPASAFEVMQRLAAFADIDELEAESVSHAYLSTPNLVARDEAVIAIDAAVDAAVAKRGGGLLIAAESGLGRSRLLEVCALKAKLSGALVLRGRAGRSSQFSLMQKLVAQLFENIPEQTLSACTAAGAEGLLVTAENGPTLKPLAALRSSRAEIHTQLAAWLRELCRSQTLVIAVDDLEGVDDASLVLLTTLASEADDLGFFLIGTLDASAREAETRAAISVLRNRAKTLALSPLTPDDMRELTRSVFGEVQHLGVLSEALSRVSAGKPRVAMELLQHLLDAGRISYRAGQWTLPAELREGDLPRSAESALESQILQLGDLARGVLELQVLASHDAFTREDYARVLEDVPALAVNDALSQLLLVGALVSDGSVYRIAHRGYAAAIERGLSRAIRTGHHRVLARLYEESQGADVLRHWLSSGNDVLAIERALALLKDDADIHPMVIASRMPAGEVCTVLVSVLDAAERRTVAPRALNDLRRAICSLSTLSDEQHFFRVAPVWLAQLAHDSGLTAFRALDPALDPVLRLGQAVKQAGAAHAATPESERVYPVPEAIRCLMQYAVVTIAIGSRTQDSALLEALPDLLAPFAGTSPIAHAIWQNTLATREAVCRAQPDLARERWLDVLQRLNEVDGGDMHRIDAVRHAVAYGIASMSAYLGLASATEWAERVEREPRQRVNALYLRRVTALQRGDANEAEAFRRKAEIASLQAATRQMFASSGAELPAHVAAQDLAGVRQLGERLVLFAQRSPGWRAHHRAAEGYFELLRGDYAAASGAFEQARELADPGSERPERNIGAWVFASAGLIETLIAQQAFAEARSLGLAVMEFCDARKIQAAAFSVVRALAMAEAKLGDFAAANVRLEALIATQETLGVKGVYLGVSYEVRARVAIWAASWDDVGKYAALAAREYRHGKGSLLAGRYERLMDEVRKSLRRSVPMGTELSLISSVYGAFPGSTLHTRVTDAFHGQLTSTDRSGAALALICEDSGAAIGHLFLNTDGGFMLAASHGAFARSALVDKVRAYLRAEQSDNQLAAVVTETVHGLDARFLIDGVQYTVLPLACSLSGHICSVGVVVLSAVAGAQLRELDASLLEGIALKLLQTGDAVSIVNQRASEL
jgi:hypothetical protein